MTATTRLLRRRAGATRRPRPEPFARLLGAPVAGGGVDFPPLPLALRGIEGCITVTRNGLRAWYRLGPQQWSWQGDDRRENLIRQIGDTYSALSGRSLHIRTVQRPYPIHQWAKALAEDTPHPSSRDAWGRHLVDVQRHLRGSTFSDTETYVGVSLTPAHRGDRITARSRAKVDADLVNVDALMAFPGLDAVRAEQHEVEWLVHRSLGLGLPQPHTVVDGMTVPVETSDLPMFTGTLDVDPSPGKPYVRLIARPQRTGDAAPIERYATVLTFI